MLTNNSNQTSSIWVEVRVDDGYEGNGPRHVSNYIGQLSRDVLDAWTRIEHGECWFALTNVLWYYTPPAEPPMPQRNWLSSLMAEDTEPANEIPDPRFYPLVRQDLKADYWGYSDTVYLRLDRVYRIIPLSADCIEQSVMPAISKKTL